MDGLRPRDRSPVWLALYSICVVCVFSFVLFEMLDVDGSDLKMLITLGGQALLPSPTDDDDGVRRVVMQLFALTELTTAIDRPSVAAAALSAGRLCPIPVVVISDHPHRIALPRASLEIARLA